MSTPDIPKGPEPEPNSNETAPTGSESRPHTIHFRTDPGRLQEAVASMMADRAALHAAFNERALTAVLTNVAQVMKDATDRAYVMGATDIDDITKTDPVLFALFRGLDGGLTYVQMRAFANFFSQGMARRRTSGVPGTEDS